MGFDIYIKREAAASKGIEARVVGVANIPQWYVDEEGWECYLPDREVIVYGIYVDNVRQECSNIYVTNKIISWRSGPTNVVYQRLPEKDYNVSF